MKLTVKLGGLDIRLWLKLLSFDFNKYFSDNILNVTFFLTFAFLAGIRSQSVMGLIYGLIMLIFYVLLNIKLVIGVYRTTLNISSTSQNKSGG